MTLLEMIVAIGVFALVMTICMVIIRSLSTQEDRAERFLGDYREVTAAFSLMGRDMASAYLSANEDQSVMEENRRTIFLGEESVLRFSSLGHLPMWAEANESEQTMISYYLENVDGKENLYRRESRRLSNEKWDNESGEVFVLVENVTALKFEYYNWKEKKGWENSWSSAKAEGDQKNRMPSMVRISVTIRDEKRRKTTFVSQAKIMLQEELRF